MTAIDVQMHRSFSFRLARAALIWSERNLPSHVYGPMYRTAFRAYRFGLEKRYAASRRGRVRRHDWSGVRQADAVLKAMPHSLVGPAGLEATYEAVTDVIRRGVPGSLVECGVAQGGGSAVMALASRDADQTRHLWLVDSFEGLPDPTAEDFDGTSGSTGAHIRPLPKGSCLGTLEEVHDLMTNVIGLDPDRFTLVKGWFQDTVSDLGLRTGQIAVLRLDGDWYESTKVCLEALYPYLASGGVLIVDDYDSCLGSKRALDEFLSREFGPGAALRRDGSGGVTWTKPGHDQVR
jgi:O-methyltransferase